MATCYLQDGVAGDATPGTNKYLVPCYPTTSSTPISPCCGANALCLSNGLCYNQDEIGDRLSTGGCTDSEWPANSTCRKYCPKTKDTVMSIFLAVAGELDDGAKSATFCCGQYDIGTGNCTNCNEPRTLDRGYVYYPNTQMTLEEYTTSLSTGTNGIGTGDTTIGMATGVALGVQLLIALALVWHLLRRLKKAKKSTDEDGILLRDNTSKDGEGEVQLSCSQADSKHASHTGELAVDQAQVSEMAHEPERQELDIQR